MKAPGYFALAAGGEDTARNHRLVGAAVMTKEPPPVSLLVEVFRKINHDLRNAGSFTKSIDLIESLHRWKVPRIAVLFRHFSRHGHTKLFDMIVGSPAANPRGSEGC